MEKLCLALPTGSFHGWGVCGKYLTRELARLADVTLVTEPFDLKDIGDELDYALLKSKLWGSAMRCPADEAETLPYPVLQSIGGPTLAPYRPRLSGRPTVGYTFFEDNLAVARYAASVQGLYDTIVAGSRWCEQYLRYYGIQSVTTILQGVDGTFFNPEWNDKEYWKDKFVVFSGGKFEFRKGQDLVIRAFKVLHDRHRDVLLVNAWHNFWPFSIQTMCASRHITFSSSSGDCASTINRVLADNGIDRDRVVTLTPRANLLMARFYKNSDIGLFPNRCEGGTNLVLMEYMACGKPVLASYNSGHKDILTSENALLIRAMRPLTVRDSQGDVAFWDDPDLDETVSLLEWAYQNRDGLRALGERAGSDMARLTWRSSAEQFYRVLTGRPANPGGTPANGDQASTGPR